MVQTAANLCAQTPSPTLSERLADAEARGEIPASEEPTSFSIAQRFRPEASTERLEPPLRSRSWQSKAFVTLLVLAAFAPSVLIGVMLWYGMVKAPASGVVIDRLQKDVAEGKKAVTESLEAKTSPVKPPVERPLVAMSVPETLEAHLGRETPFVITMDSDGPLPPRALITVNGMPAFATFSTGRPYGRTGWTLQPDEIGNLSLIASKTGEADLQIDLVTADGIKIASGATHVDVMGDPIFWRMETRW